MIDRGHWFYLDAKRGTPERPPLISLSRVLAVVDVDERQPEQTSVIGMGHGTEMPLARSCPGP